LGGEDRCLDGKFHYAWAMAADNSFFARPVATDSAKVPALRLIALQ